MWFGVVLPIGFGCWVPLVAGFRARQTAWIAWGVFLVLFALASFTISSIEEDNQYGGGFLIVSWMLHGATSFALMRPYHRRMVTRSRYEDVIAAAEHVAEERAAVIELARKDPTRAAALGVGRPDLPHARHGHVVDLNHAPKEVVATLPGVSDDLAGEIVTVREELGGFDSVEDLGALMTLHPRIVEAMRTRAVTLPD